jgi:hypothetical protein
LPLGLLGRRAFVDLSDEVVEDLKGGGKRKNKQNKSTCKTKKAGPEEIKQTKKMSKCTQNTDLKKHVTYVVHSYLGLGRGLHEGAVAELPGKVEALVLADDALLFEVTLVPYQHHGNVVSVLHGEKKELQECL